MALPSKSTNLFGLFFMPLVYRNGLQKTKSAPFYRRLLYAIYGNFTGGFGYGLDGDFGVFCWKKLCHTLGPLKERESCGTKVGLWYGPSAPRASNKAALKQVFPAPKFPSRVTKPGAICDAKATAMAVVSSGE